MKRHLGGVDTWTSGLKAWMARFKGIATKNLPTYLGWRRMIAAQADELTAEAYLTAAVAWPSTVNANRAMMVGVLCIKAVAAS